MADINGLEKRQAALVANNVTKILLSPWDYALAGVQNINLAVMGTGKVCYKINSLVTGTNDDTANFINADMPAVSIKKPYEIQYITVVADTNVTIQWDYN